ncbi:MAG: HrcA family transcriptional regulator [Candidatus Dojkabacteria bacterium]|nr:HrcA family transcriptional regulator [Candidatus Dojkabacteria bacterium]
MPTTKGWRFFVDNLKEELNYVDASKAALDNQAKTQFVSDLVKLKNEKGDLIRQSLNFLCMLSDNPTIALIGKNVYYSGLSLLPKIPELQEEDNLQRLLQILEDYYTLSEVFNKSEKKEDVNILIGEEETGDERFKNYSVIFSEISFSNGERGFIAVIGPNRMDYQKIISSLKYISDTIKFIVNN